MAWKYVCVHTRGCARVCVPDALLTGVGPGAAASHCFPWQRLAAPRGPVSQRELCYPLEFLIVPQITPMEEWGGGGGVTWQVSSMHNVNEQNDSCPVQQAF